MIASTNGDIKYLCNMNLQRQNDHSYISLLLIKETVKGAAFNKIPFTD